MIIWNKRTVLSSSSEIIINLSVEQNINLRFLEILKNSPSEIIEEQKLLENVKTCNETYIFQYDAEIKC